ncbi:ATP/GTP-binding protein [Streptomyces sp. NBC_01142]|uniref:ATP/GTP-binding protein n=1 Tax=Streptomyces sp. NBC_01142 TaxID=2975865 RepID=UPI00225675EC|nr:ATP/GTP-binding protein [Streptomyces sp. NBC_01142]MCX4826194.1 ATP/GTP-binding protein [Streptomyces sp. NBC_01142]
MLTGRLLLVASTLVLTTLTLTGTAHAADGPGTGAGFCGVHFCVGAGVDGKPEGSKPGGSGGADQAGNGSDSSAPVCTFRKLDPQPPEGSLLWDGHKPGDGAVYARECGGTGGFTVGTVWGAEPPTGTAVDPAVLAQQAVDRMLLRGPEIGITPKPGGKGVVGMPVYMWTAKGTETYGPNTASASAGGVTVTATAKVSKIVWAMGDGKTVTCTTAGTPYNAEYGKKPSPDCGHRYSQPSSTQASGKWHVTATSTWTVNWQGGGQTGQLTETRTSDVDITVAEVQVLN